jgi:pyruvate/2-oxoglutarate dehydrogenase complex dihydrolipoamide dehydrogenase (E3) component
MTNYEYDIGIIGGGAGGLTVASGAAQLGAKTLLIEKENELGGDCLHHGCVPSKTLIKTANVFHLMKNSTRFGLPTVQLPPVDFAQVAARIKSVIATIQHHDSKERFCKLGVRVEIGNPAFTDTHTVQLNGRSWSAKTWVVATGSSPVTPPIKGLDKTPHLTNREIFNLDHLPASMIILGAGPIGIEMSQAFNRLGTKVSVVDMAPQILAKEDLDLAGMLKNVLRTEGVAFYLNSSIEHINEHGSLKEVRIKTRQNSLVSLKAEAILVALGRGANTQNLGLEQIGVDFDRRGIHVDNRLRTNHRHIYAVGDVNGGFQFTHAAGYEGSIVISNAIFHLPRKVNYTFLPWCTYSDPPLGSIGMNEKTAAAAGINYTVYTEQFADNDRSLAEGQTTGILKMLLDEKEKPIGVQILGPNADDLIAEWAAVLNGKVKLSTLAAAIHPYPSVAEINKKVAGSYFAPRIFSKKIQKGLTLFFQLKGRACSEDSCNS